MIPSTLATRRLTAEAMTAAHLPDLRQMHQDERMMAMIGGPRTEAGSIAYLDKHIAHWTEHGFGFWMLRHTETGAMIGLAGLRTLTLGGTAELETGYGFLPAWWGQGFATEIAAACVEHGFAHLDFPSIVALVHPDNAASRHVLTKLGFQYERPATTDAHTSDLFRVTRDLVQNPRRKS